MATATKTATTELTAKELEAEITSVLFRGFDVNSTPGRIRYALSERGVNCDAEEVVHSLANMFRAGLVNMEGQYGSSLDEIVVSFFLTTRSGNEAAKDIHNHYPGDGCDPAHTDPGEDDSLCHGLPGQD